MSIWGYDELDQLLKQHPTAKNGFLVDTNILISATYDLDKFHDESIAFIDELTDRKIPLYCNVNIRSEFLEIHRRILFSEAILDFEKECTKNLLPPTLASALTSFRAKYERRLKDKPDDEPLKLSEREIKEFKIEMVKIQGNHKDLWSELCDNRINNKLNETWTATESALGLNFLSLRKEDQELFLNEKPEWTGVMNLISKEGISSSDAMIINMFMSSKFSVIASSDVDVALTIHRLQVDNKHCILPREQKLKISS